VTRDTVDPRRRRPATPRRSPGLVAPQPQPERSLPPRARDRLWPTPAIEPASYRCEADVADGLEEIARDELRDLPGVGLRPHQGTPRPGLVQFDYTGDLARLLRLRTILAVYLVRRFAVPRPRALLGDEHLRALLGQIATVRALSPHGSYGTLYLSAAGSDSSVLTRLKEEIGRQTGLVIVPPGAHEGDLHLRLRRSLDGGEGWEALVRLSPRPLGARAWRVCNLEGALNATVAQAMVRLTRPDPRDEFLNLACGSGTLLIERAACAPAAQLLGCDLSQEALACARANAEAAGYGRAIDLRLEDARTLALPDASIDALCADLPFGHLVGSHEDNVALYPAILREAARVARRDAPFVLITHEVRLTEALLAASPEWATDAVLRVTLGGLHPRIFVLRRT
jgi:ubiquinone/menaquinone biosynthesis C-methylase UbiE